MNMKLLSALSASLALGLSSVQVQAWTDPLLVHLDHKTAFAKIIIAEVMTSACMPEALKTSTTTISEIYLRATSKDPMLTVPMLSKSGSSRTSKRVSIF